MTSEEWIALEDDYINRVKSIHLPSDPTPTDIKNIESMLDDVLQDARFDYARVRSAFENIQDTINSTKKHLFLQKYDDGRNNDERDALIQQAIENIDNGDGTSTNLVDMMKEARRRKLFMEEVIRILDTKHDRLITLGNLLKTESRV